MQPNLFFCTLPVCIFEIDVAQSAGQQLNLFTDVSHTIFLVLLKYLKCINMLTSKVQQQSMLKLHLPAEK